MELDFFTYSAGTLKDLDAMLCTRDRLTVIILHLSYALLVNNFDQHLVTD